MSEESLVETIIAATKSPLARQNIMLGYWCKWFRNLSFSGKDFYAMVRKNIHACDLPGLEEGHISLRQSGPFSPARLYLQLRRERLVFEICGAIFGNGFFVSSRLFDRRKEPTWVDYLVLFLIFGFWAQLLLLTKGWVWAVIVTTGIIALLWSLMRLAVLDVVSGLDRFMSVIPFLGPVYDWFFHPDTYYRQDLNNSYREAVHEAVMQAIDEMTSQKGLKPLTLEERRPILRSLDRR
ncbi:MAG: hypothetical protein ACYDH9_15225 [Limisphaerales bacterium]